MDWQFHTYPNRYIRTNKPWSPDVLSASHGCLSGTERYIAFVRHVRSPHSERARFHENVFNGRVKTFDWKHVYTRRMEIKRKLQHYKTDREVKKEQPNELIYAYFITEKREFRITQWSVPPSVRLQISDNFPKRKTMETAPTRSSTWIFRSFLCTLPTNYRTNY